MRATDRHPRHAAAQSRTRPRGQSGLPPTSARAAWPRPDRGFSPGLQNHRRTHRRRSTLALRICQHLHAFLLLALFAVILSPTRAQAETLRFNPFTPADKNFTIDLPAYKSRADLDERLRVSMSSVQFAVA